MSKKEIIGKARRLEHRARQKIDIEASLKTKVGERADLHHDIYELSKKAEILYHQAGEKEAARRNYRIAKEYEWPKYEAGVRRRLKPGLERYNIFPFLAMATLVGSLIFTSFNLTGYAIAGLRQENYVWISTGLFILGLILLFFYFRIKKKLKKKKRK